MGVVSGKVLQQGGSKLSSYLVRPMIHGIVGFGLFLLIIMILKLLRNLILSDSEVLLEEEDALLAIIGFILMWLIEFVKNLKNESA